MTSSAEEPGGRSESTCIYSLFREQPNPRNVNIDLDFGRAVTFTVCVCFVYIMHFIPAACVPTKSLCVYGGAKNIPRLSHFSSVFPCPYLCVFPQLIH